ncbi:SLBB domain-containing protein [Trueperella sp. LYQ141]|uniref:SLBB domain-containing protein n=1 Tax=Trueperella sp. LYQ141 TaxID=3391058 RepID=UPI003983644E
MNTESHVNPPPRRLPSRRSPRTRPHSSDPSRSFIQSALRMGAGEDISALTVSGRKNRYRINPSAQRVVIVFVLVLVVFAGIGVYLQHSRMIATQPQCRSIADVSDPASGEKETKNREGTAHGSQSTPDTTGARIGRLSHSEIGTQNFDETTAGATKEKVIVHVSGQVNAPGIVELDTSRRVNDAIAAAGGANSAADLSAINLADFLVDGAHIHVPAVGEAPVAAPNNASGNSGGATAQPGAAKHPIDLNHASATDLQQISGIGQ